MRKMIIIAMTMLMQPSADSAPVYSQTSSASDDWSDFADADIFMDNMNW